MTRDHVGVFVGKEEVFLNGELIAIHHSKVFHFEKYDSNLINKKIKGCDGEEFHLRVLSGGHLGAIPRTHIFVNGELVAGDILKPLIIPPCPLFCIMIFLSTLGLFFLTMEIVPRFYKNVIEKRQIMKKVEGNSPELYQWDIFTAFYKGNEKLLKLKKDEWIQKCEKHLDHNCRLASYISFFEGDIKKQLDYALKSCIKGYPLSCYQALLSRRFSVKEEKYEMVVTELKKLCFKDMRLKEREQKVCESFSRIYYKMSGDSKSFESISGKLCEEGYKPGCHNLNIIRGEKVVHDLSI